MERTRSSVRRRRRASVKPFAQKCKECVRSFVAFMFSNVGIIGLVDEAQRRASCQSDGATEFSEESFDAQTITVPVTVCLTMIVSYIIGGAMLFMKYESWDLLDGSYFCFISLSTIGFGDLVPGDKIYSSSGTEFDIELSFIFCSMYLMLGMALIAMCFNLMQEEVIHKFRRTVGTIKYMCRCNR